MKLPSIKNRSSFLTTLAFAGAALAMSPAAFSQTKDKKADAAQSTKDAREVEFHIASVDGKTHWMPEKVNVKPGETLTLVFHHDLKTGPDFHGVEIDALKIKAQVNRGKEARFNATVPADLKEKEITVKCQFHPTHQPAYLEVDGTKTSKK